MATAAQHIDLSQPVRRTFGEMIVDPVRRTFDEMIADLQAGHKTPAKPESHLQTVPVVERMQPPAVQLPLAVMEKAADFHRRQHLLLTHVNRTQPSGCHVLAWSILPKQLFDTDLGRFLMIAYDFYACGPENTLLLPATAQGSQHLSLPRHPLVTVHAHLSDASLRVEHLRQAVIADHQRTLHALQTGDVSQLYKSSERQTVYREKLSNIACDIVETAFGAEIWDAHETRFRKLIQSL